MRALVTGATGFIGHRVARLLLERGYTVRCLVRKTSKTDALEKLPGIELAVGSLSDEASLEAALAEVDLVFHLAGLVVSVDRAGYFRANADGTERLARAALRVRPGLKRFLYVSSLAAAGPSAPPKVRTEEDPERPITYYGKSKQSAEQRLRRLGGALPLTVLRPPSVYGPGDVAILPFFQAAARGIGIRFAGPELYLSLAHVDDVARALVALSESDRSLHRTYFISDGEGPYTISWIQRRIAAAAGKRATLVPVPRFMAPPVGAVGDALAQITGRAGFVNRQKITEMLQAGWCCSSRRLREEIGFRPSKLFAENGAVETLAWYRRHAWL